MRSGGETLLHVHGSQVVNRHGQTIANVTTGTDEQRALLGAAFLVYCT